MEKKYGIGFLIGMIIVTLILVCALQLNYDRSVRKMEAQKETREKAVQTEGVAKKQEHYIIKEKDGYIIVYLSDEKTVYEYTSIQVKYLPENIQEEVKKGKIVSTIGQVYGFLENYSS